MNRFEQQLKKEAEHIRLSAAEKGAMRARLKEAMAPATAASSPLVPNFVEGYFSRFEFFGTARYAFAALLMIVFVGGGTVSAAQGALPGDLLYTVKTSFNEQVELAWADTADEEALVEARFAQRRVAEAEALEAEGRLDEEIALDIEERFDTHASRALALAGGDEEGEDHDAGAGTSRTLTFKVAPPDEEPAQDEPGEPVALMAVPADEPGAEASNAEVDLQAAVEAEARIEEQVDEVLQKQRERLGKLRERLNERREAILKAGLNASTTTEVQGAQVGAHATGTVEVEGNGADEEQPAEDEGEGEQPVSSSGDSDPIERIIEETLPFNTRWGF